MSIRALCITLPNPERVYRSGFYDKPSGLRGHTFTMVDPPPGWAEDPESFPETPDLWQCLYCYEIDTGWQIRERWLERCRGRVRALAAPVEGRLFAVPEVEAGPVDERSATERRTARARAAIASGRHPFGDALMIGTGETCGTCDHAENVAHGRRRYWKCLLVGITRGPGTDLRVSWPACARWERTPGA